MTDLRSPTTKKKKHLCVSSLILLEDRTNNAADNHAEKLYEKGGF